MKSRSMENTNHIFGTGSSKESDLLNAFSSALDGSCQELNCNDRSLDIDWNDQYQISHNEVITPFFENVFNQSNSIQPHVDLLKFNTQLRPEFILNTPPAVPDSWSFIDWRITGQPGPYIPNATTDPGSTPGIESGAGTSSRDPNHSHHASPSESAAAADRSRSRTSRRIDHYRIEKKYRTNINDKIRLLDEMLPENIQAGGRWMDSGNEDGKDSSNKRKVATKRSKGEVLSLVIDYIVFLRKKEEFQERCIQELEGRIWTSRKALEF
ncbi:helix-loop-helix DNA-binding domain-containing protein [Penicillium canescens]|uniref:Helix-loop-helix DNA-binding domain-containing protein n=1 Tax=Penicillium canescens TaxID=5083 RepID=A0AAD6IGV9_PENCN|nr:helix-loop-helix DNA-binding domain-containing protein [Penicillium canescens]KAJ6029297.1 helix-loop-helix DNA-binding domain-containing protein [Penicillium canescens]KAJ6047728.1 helix-loop-helix DNA-binding domain-containing protein [Penicillium canescens]KAJ6048673.1 helix-loop-helix DNA-binding domain-containing protein [Penicillium canescens]